MKDQWGGAARSQHSSQGSNARGRAAIIGASGSAQVPVMHQASHQMDETAVRVAYRRWAPVYDYTFGAVSTAGRRAAVDIINKRQGRVLEVGVGTGLALPRYAKHLEIVGIDLAPEMLDKARDRVKDENLSNITGLHEMDAGDLAFADESFDTVVAMYVMTVVPNPERVMRELARVVKPGGEVMLVNHFSQDEGVRGWIERKMAPFADMVGWHSVFDVERVMVCDELKLMKREQLRPMGIFTMLRFVKDEAESKRQIAAE